MPQVSFDYTPFGNPITWVTGLMVAGTHDQLQFSAFGSGFLAGPELAFTARHVVDDISKRFAGKLLHELTGEMPFGVQLATSHPSNHKLLRWDVIDYHYSPEIDITGLTIKPAEDLDFPMALPRFEVVPPSKGMTITGFGYPNAHSRQLNDGTYRVKLDPRKSTGVIQEVHYQYRDRVMLPFPCMHTSARFDHGMSGGPVFNENGHVCAVIATDMSTPREDGQYDSHASLIWPAFGLRFNRKGQCQNPPRFIRNEAETGRIQVFHLDHVSIDLNAETQRHSVHFNLTPNA